MNDEEEQLRFLRAVQPKSRADRQEQDHRADQQQIDQITVPRAISSQDRVGELIILAHRELIGGAQGLETAREKDEDHETEQRPGDATKQEFARDHAKLEPAIQGDDGHQGDEDEESVFLRQDHEAKADGVGGEEEPVARGAQIFPEHPETEQRPKGEEAVDERVLRHVDLRRGEAHQGRDGQSARGSLQTPGEDGREQEGENAEERGHGVKRGERFRSEDLVPEIGGEDVEKTERRQN